MSIQFSYYRNIHASHMILTPALEGEPWEKEMLWRNRPRELILPEYNSRNGQTQLWYDITGKQAVDMLAELSDISYEIFIKICEAVVAMAEVLDGLLIYCCCARKVFFLTIRQKMSVFAVILEMKRR